MANELQEKLKEVANCISNAEEETAVFILLMSLKEFEGEVWQEQFWTLIELKKFLSTIPAENRRLVHCLLEQTLMACIVKSLSGQQIRLSLPECKEMFLSKPDFADFITPQEALKCKLGQLSFMTAQVLAENNWWQEIPFFLAQAQGRHAILDKDAYLSIQKVWRDNQEA